MSYTPAQRRKNALKLKRDTTGHFISKSTAKANSSAETERTTEENFLTNLIHTETKTDAADDTLVSVKVNNPFHKIIKLLQEIKSKQSTTVAFRFTIPLIALPVILFAVFQLGKAQGGCLPMTATKIGRLKTVTVVVPKEKKWQDTLDTLFGMAKPLSAETMTKSRTLLIDPDNNVTEVKHTATLNLVTYENQQVLVTGDYSACTAQLTLSSPENIVLE